MSCKINLIKLGIVLTICCLVQVGNLGAQNNGLDDSESPLFVANLSPIILPQGAVEVTNTSSIISYWNRLRLLSNVGGIATNTYRLSLFQNRTSIYYGFSEEQKWDLGAEVTYSKRRWDDMARSSPFKVLSGDELNANGVSHLGVKLRAAPFESLPELTLQSTVRIPIANGEELRRDLGASQAQVSIFSTYFKRIEYGSAFLLQGGWTYLLPKTTSETNSQLPGIHSLSLAGFLSLNVWSQRIFLVPGLSYSGNFKKSGRSSRILQLSHGVLGEIIVQFQINPQISLTLQQSYPLLFESYAPNVEFERRSFYASSLSIRAAF